MVDIHSLIGTQIRVFDRVRECLSFFETATRWVEASSRACAARYDEAGGNTMFTNERGEEIFRPTNVAILRPSA